MAQSSPDGFYLIKLRTRIKFRIRTRSIGLDMINKSVFIVPERMDQTSILLKCISLKVFQ